VAWCKASSLTAAVARSLKGRGYPASRAEILASTVGATVEGWVVGEFLEKSLTHSEYPDIRAVMADLETWLEKQG
jgi:hypothetical protein